jgi:hypothetical protein
MMSPLLILLAWAAAVASAAPAHTVKAIVIDARSHAPIYGATVSLRGKRLAVTDKAGRFHIELPETGWTSALVIAAPGHAPQETALPHIPGDADLKAVALSTAARLHVIVPPMFARDTLRWRLIRLIAGRPMDILQEGSFAAGSSEAMIDGLPATNFLLVVRGERPLQQAAFVTSTREGESTDLPVNIAPLILKLTVRAGNRPQSGAIVRFIQHDQQWGGTVLCNEQGMASEEMWQSGEFFIGLIDHDRMGFARSAYLQSDSGIISWTFEIPGHRVKGRVVDSVTQEALRNVTMTLRGTAPRDGGLEGVEVVTDEDGRFEFGAVQEGEHSLRAYRKGYRYDQLKMFAITKDDDDYESDILLEKIVDPHSLIVVDASGDPVASADIFFVGDSGIEPLEHTDNAGRVILPPHRPGMAFAVPPAGSFGFARVSPDMSEDVTLHIPPPSGSMEVISQSAAGEAIPGVFFVMRVNGTMIPMEVFGRFANRHGLSLRTDGSGHTNLQLLPAGLYDLWPVRSDDDVRALFSRNQPQPAATVTLSGTPQVVTMTFKRVPSK